MINDKFWYALLGIAVMIIYFAIHICYLDSKDKNNE